MILEVRKLSITYYLLYIHKWSNHTPRSTHVTYRAVRTTAAPTEWKTDPNLQASISIPDRILHIFTEEPELLSILDYQPLCDINVVNSVVVQSWIDSSIKRSRSPIERRLVPSNGVGRGG